MKLRNLLYLSVIVSSLAACKKGNPITKRPLELLKDSVSYTVNGKNYVSNQIERGETFTTQSNAKITSGANFNYLIQGDKDSILFVRTYASKANNSFMVFSFIKVYANSETELTNENNGGYLNYPKNKAGMFSPGMYKYATDLFRNNSISGVAIRVINDHGEFKSYGQLDLSKPASVTQNDQRDSKFEIMNIQKRKSDYLIEAKFNLNTFNEDKQAQKIENGYLRFSVVNIQ